MSDSEEDNNFYYFGTPLEPYDEDTFPKKKPIAIEDQVARDAQGRRRFHGAFTGGFSAGFFNTVSTLEGWRPSEFKSSRSERSQTTQQQCPEDFMDDEDVGEFGIAPQVVRTTKEYEQKETKRKRQVYTGGPIPGVPVLETFLQSGNETVGYFLMRNMRNKHRQKENQQQIQTTSSGAKVYGCEIPKHLTDEIQEHPEYDLHPTYRENLARPKANTFGLGYIGLREQSGEAAKIFNPASLTVHERGKKKLSISGQAFGVGAFEEDDEDIYVKEDMSKYDYELTGEAQGKKVASSLVERLVFGMFIVAKGKGVAQEQFPPPIIPASFSGKHNVKKSRFEPVASETPQQPVKRKEINASIRAKYLGESYDSEKPTDLQTNKNESLPEKCKSELSSEQSKNSTSELLKPQTLTGLIFDKFVSASQTEDISNILEKVKPTGYVHGTQEMQDAVRMKMFGPLTRVMIPWTPAAMLCKRFNVPEPSRSVLDSGKNRKRTKNLIFEYQKHVEENALPKPGLFIPNSSSTNSLPIPDRAPETESSNNTITEASSTSISVTTTIVEQNKTAENDNTSTTKDNVFEIRKELSSNSAIEQSKKDEADVEDDSGKNDISKNTDLFKAIFLSSSESEAEDDDKEQEKEQKQKKDELLSNVLLDQLVPKIRPIKEGILSNIDFKAFQSSKAPEKAASPEPPPQPDPNIFGPSLPTNKVATLILPTAARDRKEVDDDEWVEKSETRKEKKHKSHKHKKKHKHKHKR